MGIPAFQKDIRLFKLEEKGIEAVLGQPIDELHQIAQAVRALHADPPMVKGGPHVLLFRLRRAGGLEIRHIGAPGAGIEEDEADKFRPAVSNAVAVVRVPGDGHGNLQPPAALSREHGHMLLQGLGGEGEGCLLLGIAFLFIHSVGPLSPDTLIIFYN